MCTISLASTRSLRIHHDIASLPLKRNPLYVRCIDSIFTAASRGGRGDSTKNPPIRCGQEERKRILFTNFNRSHDSMHIDQRGIKGSCSTSESYESCSLHKEKQLSNNLLKTFRSFNCTTYDFVHI